MRFDRILIPAIGLIALAIAGCQPVPQPFQPGTAQKTSNPLLDLPDRSGVVVRPVAGMPGESGRALAEEMATALIDRNLPAFTGNGNRSSLILRLSPNVSVA